VALLAEAGYPHWKAYFGHEPKKADLPLLVDVRATREGFLAALRRAGTGPEAVASAGGYYDPTSRVSYLYLQPHDSSTRLLVLHELTHQVQAKVALDNDLGRAPVWQKEGIAEHFGFHRRTAAGVEVGALDTAVIDERPLACAERVAAGPYDAWAVATGTAKAVDYTDAMILVETFLRTKDDGLRQAYKRFEADLEKGGDPFKKAERALAGKQERLAAAVREVWGAFRRPWKIVYVGWDEEPGAIVGHGMPWALLRGTTDLPRAKTSIEGGILLGGREAAAGALALGVRGPDDLVALEVRADGRLLLRRKARGLWYDLGGTKLAVPPTREPVRVGLEAVGPTLRVLVGGVPAFDVDGVGGGLTSSDFDGPAGLAAEGGPVRFVDVRTGL
jgi:hypothetical protein